MQHIQPIPILLHDEYAPRCYVQYYSKLETMDLGEITQLTQNPKRLLSHITPIITNTTSYILFNNKTNTICVYSINGGLCFSLGINDYSYYSNKFKETGDYVYNYTINDDTYLSILNKKVLQGLIKTCFKSYQEKYGQDPQEIYIKVSSKKEYYTKLFNYTPDEDEVFKYKKIENLEYNDNFEVRIEKITNSKQIKTMFTIPEETT